MLLNLLPLENTVGKGESSGPTIMSSLPRKSPMIRARHNFLSGNASDLYTSLQK